MGLIKTILLFLTIGIMSCTKFVWDNPNDNINFASAPASINKGIVSFYPFNGNAQDVSGFAKNGFQSNVRYAPDRKGLKNGAVSFSKFDNSYISVPTPIENVVNSFTVTCWVLAKDNDILISEGTLSNSIPQESTPDKISSGYMTIIHPSHGVLWGDQRENAGMGFTVGKNQVAISEHSDSYVFAPLVYNANLEGWHLITIVYDNHIPKLYVDGVFIKSGVVSNYKNIRPSNGSDATQYEYSGFGRAFSGKHTKSPSPQFEGLIDDFKIYNRVLSQSEISWLYKSDK